MMDRMKTEDNMMIKAILVMLFGVFLSPSFSVAQESKSTNDKWIGQEIWYKYNGGMEFHVKFENAGISYQNLHGSKPETWWGPFTFNSILTKKGEYLISWYEEGYGDYVTLLINENDKTLFGSALIIGKGGAKTHLQPAEIYKRFPKK